MSGQLVLDWPALTLSLLNAFLLCWLGFTVILEADRRSLGVWVSAEGLFLGAVFFIAHTAILRNGWQWDNPLLDFWWRAGWWPLILSPFAWYCVILWYSGFWDEPDSSLHRRQATWFGLILVATAFLLGWMILADPLPDLGSMTVNPTGFLILAFVFPAYIMGCILLSLDAILRPGPTARLLGNEARKQARPWLTASTLVLLLVCLLVAFSLVWGIQTFMTGYSRGAPSADVFIPLTGLDVLIEILITLAILLIGQAAMVYEVFSSSPVPRSSLRKRWLFAIITGVLFSLILSGVLMYFARSELAYLFIIPFITATMTLQNRQSALEREKQFGQIRSLAQPGRTYERIFSAPEESREKNSILAEFDFVCTSLLRTEKACLVPVGVMASFLPSGITYPRGAEIPADLPVLSSSQMEKMTPVLLDQVNSPEYHWAIPLISSRGLDGWLFFSQRREGGFFTLEEIETAQSAVERWMDNQASAEIARRLVNLQQQKLTETRLTDQKTRQILHDDVLPLLHTALLANPKGEGSDQITAAHQQISRLLRDVPRPAPVEITTAGLFPVLKKLVTDEAEFLQARLSIEIEEQASQEAEKLSSDAAETVFYAVRESLRNIEKHRKTEFREQMGIHFRAIFDGGLVITIENTCSATVAEDEKYRTSGQGIRLYNAMLAVFGGGMHFEQLKNNFSRVTINLPSNLSY